jgi:hypothetical protein
MSLVHLLTYTGRVDYDEYASMVIVAETEREARKMAQEKALGETVEISGKTFPRWIHPVTEHRLIAEHALDPTPRIVCSDFNAG